MIFNCPACSAGHSVPVSMIPNGGMEITCRRCAETFSVDVEDEEQVEEDADPTQAAKERTTIGVANPYDELVGDAQLMSPMGEVFDPNADSTDDTQSLGATHDRPTIPISTDGRHVPLGPDEQGVDPELDNTQRLVEQEDHPTYEPSVEEISSPPPPRNVETPPPRAVGKDKVNGRPPVGEGGDVYDQVASGSYTPQPKDEVSSPHHRQRAWNEASSIVQIQTGPASGLRRLAEALNTAPLAVKVALIVFPLTLGITLVITAMMRGGDDAPVQIETTAAQDEAPADSAGAPDAPPADPAPEGGEAPPPKSAAAPAPPPPPSRRFVDPPAPQGHAYVQNAGARLRATADARGRTVARLPAGQLVRRVEQQGDRWLVLATDKGPVGFIEERALGEKKPVEALANDVAFEGCSIDDKSVDDCLFSAKEQEGLCMQTCGPPEKTNPTTIRCRGACEVAFDRCARECNPPKRKRRRRRR